MNIYIWGIILIVVLAIGGTIKYQASRIEGLKVENFSLERDKIKLEAEARADKILDEARAVRQEATTNKAIDNAIRADNKKKSIEVSKLERTSAKKAKLVERLSHKAIINNIGVLACKSDLRSIHDENACPAFVR